MKKDDLPAMPFYVGDWLKAPDIRALTPAAKGLWIDMLCFMWESPERGVLKLNNKIVDRELLSKMTGFARDLLDVLLDEMEELGIFSIREDGAIYSRKMVRMQEIRVIRSNAGQKGGFATANCQAKSQQITENETENENENEIENKKVLLKAFDDLWQKYPNKAGKKSALRHFLASVKDERGINDIGVALKHYLESKRVKKGFIQNGSTWFNNWQDWVEYEEKSCEKCNDTGKYVSSTGFECICKCPAGRGK